MIDIIPFFMLPVAFVLMFLGVQVAFSMMITAVLFGLYIFGDRVIFQFIEKIEDISSNFVFAAIPLFVFMGAILEKSGIADKLFEAIHIWTRRLPGGLALATGHYVHYLCGIERCDWCYGVCGWIINDSNHAALQIR
ncbi:MAG: hypothetical protein RL082_1433 [Pseudomonadota bacterium]